MLLTERAVYEDELPPRFYGLAYLHPNLRASVYYPIPFNLVVRWGRGFWWWMVNGRGNRWERALDKAHMAGFKAGKKAMIAALEEEAERLYPAKEA